jgi:hypothetical protein
MLKAVLHISAWLAVIDILACPCYYWLWKNRVKCAPRRKRSRCAPRIGCEEMPKVENSSAPPRSMTGAALLS